MSPSPFRVSLCFDKRFIFLYSFVLSTQEVGTGTQGEWDSVKGRDTTKLPAVALGGTCCRWSVGESGRLVRGDKGLSTLSVFIMNKNVLV